MINISGTCAEAEVFAQQALFVGPQMTFYIFWDVLKKTTASSLVAS